MSSDAARTARIFDVVQDLGGFGYYEIDLLHQQAVGTPQFFVKLGLPEEHATIDHDSWMQCVHPDDRAAVTAHVTKILQSATVSDLEYRAVLGDQETRWLSSRTKIMRDASGRPTYAVGVLQDVTDRRTAEADARRLATLDPLTGLANRTLLRSRAEAMLRSSDAAGSLLLIDLDRFKEVNDSLGHPVGDSLLKLVARRLRNCARDQDLIVRLGGDEFAVLMSSDDAAAVAERILAALRRPFLVDGHAITAGASIGIARLVTDGADHDALLRAADLALYEAKNVGRGVWRPFHPELEQRARSRHVMVEDLRRAAALGQLELHLQPQVEANTGRISGFEALVRWNRPGQGLLAPDAFIEVAEEHGLMPAIGAWVLNTACREAASWAEPYRIAVNVSAQQLDAGSNLVGAVAHALAQAALPAERLEIEVTETALAANEQVALGQLRALKALGVRVAMDDFGTGYSSLSRLLAFPFDRLKVDRSFVAGIGNDSKATTVVRSIAALGLSLAMETVAEGVETEDQASAVRENGFSEIQGFLVSRPLPTSEVQAFLAAHNENHATSLQPRDGEQS